jgi:hypothetical protein
MIKVIFQTNSPVLLLIIRKKGYNMVKIAAHYDNNVCLIPFFNDFLESSVGPVVA